MRREGPIADVQQADLIEVIEVGYGAATTDEAWLAALAEAARNALGGAAGAYAFLYDVSDLGRFRPDAVVCTGGLVGVDGPFLERMHAPVSPEIIEGLYRSPRLVSTSSSQLRAPPKDYLSWTSLPGDALDCFGIMCCDLAGIGVCVSIPLPAVTRLSPRQITRWERVATHIQTSFRLRRRAPPAEEAVLDPDGTVQHAEGAATERTSRVALREAARAMDRARGSLRRASPDEAVGAWRALCEGRWSLVDRFDSDGRRYLVARRNDPAAPACESLTLRERQVAGYAARGHANKFIAYALGLSTPTVAGHLAQAAHKLGVRSRAELIRLVRALGASETQAYDEELDEGSQTKRE